MAYMSTEHAKQIREELKREFPEIKFSVRKENHSTIHISIMKSPYDFIGYAIHDAQKEMESAEYSGDVHEVRRLQYRIESLQERGYMDVNHYWLRSGGKPQYANVEVLEKIHEIAMRGNHDNSDIMTDYFDVGWYVRIHVGKYEKPYQYNGQPVDYNALEQEQQLKEVA